MADFKVKLKALAYEKSHPKTKLSEYENDPNYVTYEELVDELTSLREWVVANIDGVSSSIKSGSDIDGTDVIDYDTTTISLKVTAGDIAERYESTLAYYYYGGDVASLEET